jgi:hypothetical protein
VRQDGTRQLLAFMRSSGESQNAWEGLLQDLYRRGLKGDHLLLIVTDWLSRPGGSHRDGVSAGAAPALLGAQDAQYSGESAQGGL